ncbi:ABC transporter ATP-binding protein [Rhodohalobacter sulfatireducens]|uniref:ATP-binding cassette domain-containing protein n=1 Tax=Rhodohalobacter sulfatireducens TaxID=2911366 RepID=A0ABS9KAI9_9BACT|nr:ATP-binding cassette domain-containing protein [Rhodohalobacter sulfatireducens]MCG2587869.1 ATP-binding cassette domain-containing protein [Rhodohalobacter sulfatireducens]MDR9365468.1 ATP-binding cassette domain-containing protein [Balneolaceae bacterium]MDR9408812.1 ATP-binding cassette domain-containing protein [Balneolaceae bacterium]
MIEIKNLKKSFGDLLVWEGVSFTIEEGDITAIIGRSGCGKSVLLKHINALLTPDEGEIIIDEKNIFDLDYVDKRLLRQKFGVLFQGSALFDSINTFENVAFPLRYFTNQNEEEIHENVMRALRYVNLENAAQQETAELSGGMRKRVGLARAIILEPKYIMYDEPTSGLDPQTADEINGLILDMARQFDVTSIVVTHDMHSVLEVADKVAFLDQQKLSWFGTIDEMKQSNQKDLVNFITASEYQIKQ